MRYLFFFYDWEQLYHSREDIGNMIIKHKTKLRFKPCKTQSDQTVIRCNPKRQFGATQKAKSDSADMSYSGDAWVS